MTDTVLATSGEGVAVHSASQAISIDGKMVELLHAEIARRTVAVAMAVAMLLPMMPEMEAESPPAMKPPWSQM